MAASTTDSDYFHIVCDRLEERKGKLDAKAVNAFFWEALHTDRAESLALLEPYLSTRLDLVTIQLGENATNLNTFYSDFVYLIQLIKERCPEAQILVVGDFWEYQDRDKMKERAAHKPARFMCRSLTSKTIQRIRLAWEQSSTGRPANRT